MDGGKGVYAEVVGSILGGTALRLSFSTSFA
jgi:hypothetical protein